MSGLADLDNTILDRLDELHRELGLLRRRESELSGLLAAAETDCTGLTVRLGAIEQIVAGYRRHLAAVVLCLRERQRHDLLDAASKARQRREEKVIRAAHRHDAYALRVVTVDEACADAPRPDDLPSAREVAHV